MADWLLIIPGEDEAIQHPDRINLAAALRCPNPEQVKITEIGGACFYSVAETADDPGVVIITRDNGQKCAVVASALLTERDDLIREIRSSGRNVTIECSDGELLAHAVSLWGDKTWEKPGGEFSVASWMPEKKSLLMATDGEGQRPAFWSKTGQGFVASSRFEAMMITSTISKEPDLNIIISMLSMNYGSPETNKTFLLHVKFLLLGHSLFWNRNIFKIRRWWNFPSFLPDWKPKNEQEAIERFRFNLRQSIRERLRNHKKVVISLTGGLDSTPIAAELAYLRDAEALDVEIKALHAEYPPNLNSSEAELTRLVSKTLDIPYIGVPLDNCELWPRKKGLDMWIPHHWFGYWDSFSSEVMRHGTAVFNGRSGEIFSRASLFEFLLRGNLIDIFKESLRIRKFGYDYKPWRRRAWRWHSMKPLKKIKNENIPWIRKNDLTQTTIDSLYHERNTWQLNDCPSHLRFIYTYMCSLTGKSAMYDYASHRIPAIDPFSDRRLLKLATSINPIPWRVEKFITRIAYEGVLPNQIIHRKRVPTPYFTDHQFQLKRIHIRNELILHPVLDSIIDVNEWKFTNENLNMTHYDFAWLLLLAVNNWLHNLYR